MTSKDDITRMAQESGLVRAGDKWVEPARWGVTELVHFAALVAAAEREACAKLCDEMDHNGVMIAADCAAAIRARGQS